MDAQERLWGYTGASGMVQGFATGYFCWDLWTAVGDFDVHGFGTVVHAVCALAVSGLGFVGFLLLFVGFFFKKKSCSSYSPSLSLSVFFFFFFFFFGFFGLYSRALVPNTQSAHISSAPSQTTTAFPSSSTSSPPPS